MITLQNRYLLLEDCSATAESSSVMRSWDLFSPTHLQTLAAMHCVRIIIRTGDSSLDILLLVLDGVFDFHLTSAAKSRRDIFMSGADAIARRPKQSAQPSVTPILI